MCVPGGWPDHMRSGPWLRGVDPEWAEPRAVCQSGPALINATELSCLLNSTKMIYTMIIDMMLHIIILQIMGIQSTVRLKYNW